MRDFMRLDAAKSRIFMILKILFFEGMSQKISKFFTLSNRAICRGVAMRKNIEAPHYVRQSAAQ